VDDLIHDWTPDPLVPDVFTPTQNLDLEQSVTIIGAAGPKMHIKLSDIHGNARNLQDGIQELDVIAASSFNFLGYLNNQDLRQDAVKTLRSYGVGSCGPPGFYGTLDVHMALEKHIAHFLGTEQAIIYSQGFSTISSAIPAFAKRGDLLIVYVLSCFMEKLTLFRDEAVSFAVQKGVQISRSTIKLFRHNDMAHLESLLKEVEADDKRHGRKITKRFIITEAIFANSGDIAPLPDLIRMKHEYKWRLIIEESLSLGVLGKTGRGLTEHFGIDASEVDMIAASMGNVLGSGGGFVAGSRPIVDHQRLSGQAYCFSASLPAVLAVTATETLQKMERDPRVHVLRENTAAVRQILKCPGISVSGNDASALMHLRFSDRKLYFRSRDEEEAALQRVVDEVCLYITEANLL
jgi:serine palmitoyltransferase